MRELFSSLRIRLILLVLLAVIPAFGLIVYTGLEQRRLAAADAQEEALRLVRLAATDHEQLIGSTRQFLVTLAQLPQVRGHDSAACSALFADLLAQYPFYTNFTVVEPAGDVFCSAVPLTQPVSFADREWFQRAIQTRGFTVGEYLIGRITGKAILVLAYPVLDAPGQVQAVVSAGLDLGWLNQLAAEAQLPPGSTLTVIDRHSTILARDPDPEKWVGQSVPESLLVQAILTQGEGMVEAADVDGVTRLYAFTPLRGAPGDSVYMSVGIPIAVAYADANQTLARNLTGLGLVAVLALAAAWVSSELFLLRQVKALVHATQRLAAGDLSAHTGVPYGPGELGQLARVFDQMAEALEQHEAERQRAEAALRESEERYRSLFDGVPVGLYQTTPAGQFVDANPAMVEMLGYPNRETLLTVNATSVYIDPKERRRWQVLVEQEEVVRDFEARKRRYDGTVILVRDSARAIRDAAGRVLYYEGYEEDITERKRVEEALYEQAQILSSIQDTIVIISPEMKTIYANQTAKDLFGDRPEMFTEPCYRFFKRRDNVCEDCPVLEVFKDEKPHKAILKSYDKDGREIWRYNTAFPFYDQDGRLIAGIEIVTDYTAQKMAEEALRASESEKALILSSVAELVAHQDNELRLVWANRVAGESAGLSADELVGRHCYEIWQQRSEPCIGCPVVEALETGEPHEAEMTTPDGRVWFIRGYPARGENGDVIGAVEVTQEITERNRAEKQIQRQLQRLHAMREIDMAITSSVDRSVTLNIVLDQVTSQLGVDAADVLLLDPHTQTLEYATGRGFRSAALQHTHLRLGEGYAGRAALQRNIINIPNLAEAKDSFRHSPLLPDEQFIAYYGVPLIAKGQVKGVLEIFHRAPLDPDREWLDFLEALAMQAAITIDNTELFSNLQRANAELTLAYDTTLEGWARALELRDVETEGHTQRTTDMTLRLAQAVGMSNADASAGPSTGLRTGLSTSLVHVRRGALLHDIGKMGVADTILLKPGPLTEEEWDIMRQHPVYAYEMLSPITYLRPALDIPYCHHERWDGTGYPRGLKGEQIPLAARIFAVVDVWDALLSERPYRPAWSEEEAIEYIREQAGKHFDPQVVEVFLRVIGNESTRQQGNTGMR